MEWECGLWILETQGISKVILIPCGSNIVWPIGKESNIGLVTSATSVHIGKVETSIELST